MTLARGWAALIAVACLACSRDVPTKRGESAPPPNALPRVTPVAVSALAAVWDTAAGTLFAIAGADPSEAYVIDPAFADASHLDTLQLAEDALRGIELQLLNPGDSALVARTEPAPSDSSRRCAQWPAVRLTRADGQPVTTAWQVAFPPGRASVVGFDSLPALTHADSTRLTILVARLASSAPGDTAAVFRGRPYIVRQASRFTLDDGRRVVFAEVVRVVNQEANPLQEELLLVAESEPAAASPYSIAYLDRQIGLEEAIETPDLIAVLQLRNGSWGILLRRDVGDGFRLVLLERREPARWQLRWRSAYVGC